MKTVKQRLSMMLALALVILSCANPAVTAWAAQDNGSVRNEQTAEPSGTGTEKTADAGKEDESEEKGSPKKSGMPAASSADAEKEDEPEEKDSPRESGLPTASSANAGKTEPEEKLPEKDPAQTPALTSLLPLKTNYARLLLNRWTDEQLKAVKLQDIIDNLIEQGSNNKVTVTVNEGQKILVNLYSNSGAEEGEEEYDYHLSDDYVPMELEDTLDLSVVNRNSRSDYTLELLISSGEQLDYDAVRYMIDVYMMNDDDISYNYYLYDENGDQIGSAYNNASETQSAVLEETDIPVTAVSYYIPEEKYGKEKEYSLYIREYLDASMGMTMEAYKMSDFMEYYKNPSSGLDASKKLNMIGNNYRAVGQSGRYAGIETDDLLSAENCFCIVVRDSATDEVVGYEGIIFTVYPNTKGAPAGTVSAYEGGQMINIVEDSDSSVERNHVGRSVKLSQKPNVFSIEYYPSVILPRIGYELKSGYSGNGEYYYTLDESEKSYIQKVVEGRYTTLAAAEEATDITAQVFPSDQTKAPCGYKTTFKENYSKYFTAIYKDGTVHPYYCYLWGSSTDAVPYSAAPVIGEDPYFNITGASGVSHSYHVQNTDDVTYDTLYSYGYQTLIVDEDANLSEIKLKFKSAPNVTIQRGTTVLESGVTPLDFSGGEPILLVAYFKDAEGKTRNYYVNVVKKTSGEGKLFVNYPDQNLEEEGIKREVFLTEYFENRHDILIANIGDKDITALKVELKDAQNVILDDYWTIGSKNTLKPAEDMDNEEEYDNSLENNLAKIRLLPDPNGDGGAVKGTLVISGAGDTVEIELTGYASNPKIITKSDDLDDAVKYVPYSYVIATNNMYSWNTVTFSAEGNLPPGVTLSPRTGEIYGVPKEAGEYAFTVKAEFSRPEFVPSSVDFKLTVKDNTNANVYNASDSGYGLLNTIGTDQGGYDFVLSSFTDQVFRSEGDYSEFIAGDRKVFFNGELLTENVDYTSEEGSTRITVKSQTFQNKAKRDGTQNTIAAEFRKGGTSAGTGEGVESTKEMKRTSQNFRVTARGGSSGGSGGGGGSSAAAVKPDDSWTQDTVGWRHQMADGSWASSTWLQLTSGGVTSWYYFNPDGYMATGWLTDNGNTYYLNPVSDGSQGAMATGWQFIDGQWYYFNQASEGVEGALVGSGWHQLMYNGVLDWYYMNTDRYMASGWITDNGNRYYLNPISDGFKGRMLTGWQQIDGNWYYFKEESDGTRGSLQTDTWIGEYYVNRNGIWRE